MGIEIQRTTDSGHIVKLPLTTSSFGFSNCRLTKYVISEDVAGGTGGTVTAIWSNPEIVPILIFRIIVNETSATGAAGHIRVGAANDATTACAAGTTTAIDGINANVVGWYDNVHGPVTIGAVNEARPILYMNATGAATLNFLNMESVGDCTSFNANIYIFYFPMD